MSSLLPSPRPSEFSELTQITSVDRWSIYHRLLDLSIPCSCTTGQPLKVCADNTQSVIQIWSVVKQITAPRPEQVLWLNTCWNLSTR